MKTVQNRGFTLIELLTVIAIIAILAGLVAVGGPRALEKAKLADVDSDFRGIHSALVDYQTEATTLPIPYGGRTQASKDVASPIDTTSDPAVHEDYFQFNGYMALIGQHNALDLYDRFAMGPGYDTDDDKVITLLEHQPLTAVGLDGSLYGGGIAANGSYAGANSKFSDQRPYVYIAVNSRLFNRFKAMVQREFEPNPGDEWDGETWPTGFIPNFPVPSYDEAVLLSLGPFENAGGIVSPPKRAGDASAADAEARFLASFSAETGDTDSFYDALLLRAYYLATVDRNQNGELDYDFYARVKRDEAESLQSDGLPFLLPDGTNLGGPVIYRVQ